MKKFNSVTDFLQKIGFSCKGRQGQYSYVDHDKKQVFFGIDQNNGNNESLILSSDWQYNHKLKTKAGKSYKKGNYTTSLNNISLIKNNGYQLIACKIKTEKKDGKTHKSTFYDIDNLSQYVLSEVSGSFYAINSSKKLGS